MTRSTAIGVNLQVMQEWDELFANREVAPLPVSALSYNSRAKKYARWEHRSAMAGGSDTAPRQWSYTEQRRDEEMGDDNHDQDSGVEGWSWPQSSSWWTAGPPHRIGLIGGSMRPPLAIPFGKFNAGTL